MHYAAVSPACPLAEDVRRPAENILSGLPGETGAGPTGAITGSMRTDAKRVDEANGRTA